MGGGVGEGGAMLLLGHEIPNNIFQARPRRRLAQIQIMVPEYRRLHPALAREPEPGSHLPPPRSSR